jgi:hypothetical protein
LDSICGWFNANLPVPKIDPRYWRAVFWFRADCQDLISRLWELAAILEDHGVQVRLVRGTLEKVWVVVYHDRYQIAAMPMKKRSLRVFRHKPACRRKRFSWTRASRHRRRCR